MMSATKVAPPFLLFPSRGKHTWFPSPSLAEGVGGGSSIVMLSVSETIPLDSDVSRFFTRLCAFRMANMGNRMDNLTSLWGLARNNLTYWTLNLFDCHEANASRNDDWKLNDDSNLPSLRAKRSNQRFEATHGRLPRIRTNARNDDRTLEAQNRTHITWESHATCAAKAAPPKILPRNARDLYGNAKSLLIAQEIQP